MSKTILITGATGGLGKATALELAKTGATLVLLAHDKAGLDSVATEVRAVVPTAQVETLVADLGDLNSVRAAAAQFKQRHSQLHALIHTAAVYKRQRHIVSGNLESMFAVNYLGPWLLTKLLLDTLKASAPSTVISVSAPSTTKPNFDDLQGEKKFSSLTAFGVSKMADMLGTFALAKKLQGSGVTANVYFPGLMKTKLMQESPLPIRLMMKVIAKNPAKAAAGLAKLATDPQMSSQTGQYVHQLTVKKAPAFAYNQAAQDRLWAISEKLVQS